MNFADYSPMIYLFSWLSWNYLAKMQLLLSFFIAIGCVSHLILLIELAIIFCHLIISTKLKEVGLYWDLHYHSH